MATRTQVAKSVSGLNEAWKKSLKTMNEGSRQWAKAPTRILTGKKLKESIKAGVATKEDLKTFKESQQKTYDMSKRLGYLETRLKQASSSATKTAKRIDGSKGELNESYATIVMGKADTATAQAEAVATAMQTANAKAKEAIAITQKDTITTEDVALYNQLVGEAETAMAEAEDAMANGTKAQTEADSGADALSLFIFLPNECLEVNDKMIDPSGGLAGAGLENFYVVPMTGDKIICVIYIDNPNEEESAWIFRCKYVYSDKELEGEKEKDGYYASFTVARFSVNTETSKTSIIQIAHGLEIFKSGSGGGSSGGGVMPWRILDNGETKSMTDCFYQVGGYSMDAGEKDVTGVTGLVVAVITISSTGEPTLAVDTTSWATLDDLRTAQASDMFSYRIPIYKLSAGTVVTDYRAMLNFAMVDSWGAWTKGE